MAELRITPEFFKWLNGLRDDRARARIQTRLARLREGNPGDSKPVREGVMEMRIDYGPGYRVYYVQSGLVLIVVLGGGTKKSQPQDIELALELARNL